MRSAALAKVRSIAQSSKKLVDRSNDFPPSRCACFSLCPLSYSCVAMSDGDGSSWEADSFCGELIPISEASARPRERSGRSQEHPVLRALRDTCEATEDALNEACAAGEMLSFSLRPECRLKLRKRTPLVTLGATLQSGRHPLELVAKQGRSEAPLWRARWLLPASLRRLRSAPRAGGAPRGARAAERRRESAQARPLRALERGWLTSLPLACRCRWAPSPRKLCSCTTWAVTSRA